MEEAQDRLLALHVLGARGRSFKCGGGCPGRRRGISLRHGQLDLIERIRVAVIRGSMHGIVEMKQWHRFKLDESDRGRRGDDKRRRAIDRVDA